MASSPICSKNGLLFVLKENILIVKTVIKKKNIGDSVRKVDIQSYLLTFPDEGVIMIFLGIWNYCTHKRGSP